MWENNKYIVHENNTIYTKFASADAKKYHPFWTMHDLKQLIQCPTQVTSSPSKVSYKEVINVVLSNHQFSFLQKKNLSI